MIDLAEVQKKIYLNKIAKGFNVTDVYKEFCYIQGELSEAFDAYIMKNGSVGEELADVAIFLFGLAEILGVNLEEEINKKIEKNEKRLYIQREGIDIEVTEG